MKISVIYLISTVFALTLTSEASAESGLISTHGFIAQGVIKADGSNFVDDRGDESLALTEMGFNAAYRLSSKVRVAGQMVYLNGGNRYPEGVRLDYLFLDWELLHSLDWQVNLHLGRYKNYHWLYSATRDVPHTRPSIVLPQSIYFDAFRDVALGSDGIALRAQTDNAIGDWEFNWSYGSSPISKEQMRNLLSNSANGDLEQDYTHQMSVKLRPALSNLHLGISLLDSDFTYSASPEEPLISGDSTVQRLMLEFKYMSENWELSAELMREKVLFRGLFYKGFLNKALAEGGYIQGRYFLSPEVNLLARLDLFDRDREDRGGRLIELASGGIIPGYFGYSDQGTLGLQWDFHDNMRLQFEYHRVKGTGRLAPVLSPNLKFNNQKYWDIFAVQLMYWF